MINIDVSDLDCVFLSYHEPNKQQNWQRVSDLCPRAKRVDGVSGSDAAHKACAQLARTDRVLIIDGDNWVNPDLFEFSYTFHSEWEIDHSVLSFPAQNSVNGLRYGNGGIKIWPRRVIEQMRTHETCQDLGLDGSGVDFCWAVDYVLMPQCLSETRINHTAEQAWRAGFREGIKMALINGQWVQRQDQWLSQIAKVNLRRLETWLNVGQDVENGVWAILGARQGLSRIMLEGWDPRLVHDFAVLDRIWADDWADLDDPLPEIRSLGSRLAQLGIAVGPEPLSALLSRWHKYWQQWQPPTEPRRLRA